MGGILKYATLACRDRARSSASLLRALFSLLPKVAICAVCWLRLGQVQHDSRPGRDKKKVRVSSTRSSRLLVSRLDFFSFRLLPIDTRVIKTVQVPQHFARGMWRYCSTNSNFQRSLALSHTGQPPCSAARHRIRANG